MRVTKRIILFTIMLLISQTSLNIPVSHSETETKITINYPSRYQQVLNTDTIYVEGQMTPNPPNTELQIIAMTPEDWNTRYDYSVIPAEDGSFNHTLFEDQVIIVGQWTITVQYLGDDPEYSVSVASVAIDVELDTNIEPPSEHSTDKKECYFKLTAGAVECETSIRLESVYLLEKGTELPISYAEVEIHLNKPGGGIYTANVVTDSEGDLSFSYSTLIDGTWEILLFFGGSDQYKPAELSIKCTRKGPCIIATAAYCSMMHPDVKQMRSLRDDKVGSSFTGNNFVNLFLIWYYSWSPRVACIISGSGLLRGVFRVLLIPLVYSMRVAEIMYDVFAVMPELASCVSVLTAAALCGVFYVGPLFIVLSRLGLVYSVNRRSLAVYSLFLVVLVVWGSLIGSVLLNTAGFGSLAVLITMSTGYMVSKKLG
jgi:hypothetical protein